MNKRKWLTFVCILAVVLIVLFLKTSLTQNNNSNKFTNVESTGTHSLSVDDIKKRYTGGEKGTIVNITDYQHYVLVEYNTGNKCNCFDWYNLDTGECNTLPIGAANAKLKEIKSPDDIVFITDGTYNVNSYKSFPYIIECVREQKDTNSKGDFTPIDKARYFMVEQGVEFGNKGNEVLQDITITPEYVQMSFAPAKGYEDIFNAAYTAIPPTETSFINDKRQLAIEFEDTQLSSELLEYGLKYVQSNEYFESVELEQVEKNVKVLVNLKNGTKFYNARVDRRDFATEDETPFVRFYFGQNDDNNEIINSH